MALQVEELSIQLIEALVPLMPRIRQRDKTLEDQLRRAASSIGLNAAEASMSDPGNRRARLCTAAGSAAETPARSTPSGGVAAGERRRRGGVDEARGADRGDPLADHAGVGGPVAPGP